MTSVTTRRAFIGTLAGGLAAAPFTAGAQQTGRVSRIGILANYRFGEPDLWGFFIQGLRELGYVEGRNIAIEWRVSEGKYERLPGLAAELARLKVDVIVVPANQNALAARQATQTIPIVMIGVTDPVGSGLVANLARPGGNITGLSGSVGPELAGKQLELLKAAVPQASRVAILWNPGNPANAVMLREAGIVARSLMVQVQALEARGPDDFGRAFTAMTRERAGAVLILGDGMFALHQTRIVDFVAKSRLPVMGSRSMVAAGVLMSYGTNTPELWRRAATYVDKILKGAKPADLPVEQPTKFELVINLKTAKALRLTIAPSLLQRADEVIQ
ncbi:MAG TPA: ABC transporter substrate-binding protein [Methylomirabilota bacterium]|nr:ABC transporter substrate-binding protein [Methylomirabilota bacterium]